MTAPDEEAEEVARGLTETQRKIMLGVSPVGRSQHGGWTRAYPKLFRLGLLDNYYRDTPLGHRVAAVLRGKP